jgi:hypothetical protein
VWPDRRFSCLTPIAEQIIYHLTLGVLGASYHFVFTTKTARKWHIDCMESQDLPALRKQCVRVVHIKQRKAGRILF